jgi:phosphoglycerate dehydrogenase-like enzyme
MTTVNILSLEPLSEADQKRIQAIDPRVTLTMAVGWFDGEIRENWPDYTVRRYLRPDANGKGTRAERDALLAEADVIFGGFPPLKDMRARAPKLKWFHQRPAGASNLLVTDLWESDVAVTTSRGYANSLPIAEYALTTMLYFAKGLHRAEVDRASKTFNHREYKSMIIEGKTACVVGAGGIGLAVGKLCAAVGMRVVGTRRTPPKSKADLPAGFSDVRGPDALHALLAASDFVAVCCQWTPETEKLFNAETFAAMKPGAVLVNVARGEIIDEEALVAALAADRLRGVALDVYVGEFERDPDPRLWADPRVMITPHTSSISDESRHRGVDLFCENLRLFLDGKPLKNVLDWDQGY